MFRHNVPQVLGKDRDADRGFLCMLAYYVEWHLRRALAPMLYDDEDKEAVLALRKCPVAKAPRSSKAYAKETTKRTEDGLPVHSFQSLLKDLGTLCLNIATTTLNPNYPIAITTRPTPIQSKALELLGISMKVLAAQTAPDVAECTQ